MLEAIAHHGRRIVYLSSSGVHESTERQTDPVNRLHADMERLIEGSGVEWTFLRSNTIASNARAGPIRSAPSASFADLTSRPRRWSTSAMSRPWRHLC
ncbi:hypothetical protein ACIHEJ_33010 [Streptomyces sp. NPDC052301]|uniref:hypothetical protein n=1 Tax=Streptomyces sp. NPDC052301 TaxID=3365687 RepID=UPI0037CE1CD1